MAGFGVSRVNHKYEMRGKLSWQRIGELLNGKDMWYIAKHSKNYWLHEEVHMHPATRQWERARCYRMYQTDILRFFEDGACVIVTHPSAITYNEISQWGPVRCFTNNQLKYEEKRRFGSWQVNYPIPDGTLKLDAAGYVLDPVVDAQTVMDPKKRKERAGIARDFRAKVLPRMLLHEFGDIFAVHTSKTWKSFGRHHREGWWARVSPHPHRDARMLHAMETPDWYPAAFGLGKAAESHDHAVRVACDHLLFDGLLGGKEWLTETLIDYGKVNVLGE